MYEIWQAFTMFKKFRNVKRETKKNIFTVKQNNKVQIQWYT